MITLQTVRNGLVAAVLALLVNACALFTGGDYAERRDYNVVTNIPYYKAAAPCRDTYMNDRCRLDVYYPVSRSNYSTVVWFHGGGLRSGNRSIPAELKDKGMAVVAVGYRLFPKVHAPCYIEDAAASVAWVFNHIGEYGGDTNGRTCKGRHDGCSSESGG